MRNPGRSGGDWTEHLIDAAGPTQFAFLVDLDNALPSPLTPPMATVSPIR